MAKLRIMVAAIFGILTHTRRHTGTLQAHHALIRVLCVRPGFDKRIERILMHQPVFQRVKPPIVQPVDFSYASRDFLVFNTVGSLALVITNLSYTNKTLLKEIIIHNSTALAPLALSLPANWITLSNAPTSANLVPTAIPPGNDLRISLLVSCGATTNIYATYSYAWNPAPTP